MMVFTLNRTVRYLVAALLLSAIAFPVPAWAEPGNDNRAPDLSGLLTWQEELAGHKVAFYAYAEGVQIYRWNGTSWVFQEPDAVLYANPNAQGVVGTHYIGPTWESNSGSYVVGSVFDRYTPDPTAIPWLLLRAVDRDGPGVFHRVTHIARVNTEGGMAPSAPGTFVGQLAEVPYTADYYFFREHK